LLPQKYADFQAFQQKKTTLFRDKTGVLRQFLGKTFAGALLYLHLPDFKINDIRTKPAARCGSSCKKGPA
jgi:hypothetical protein